MYRSKQGLDTLAWWCFNSESEKLQFTWTLNWVLLLAVAVTADVIEGKQKVVLLMQLGR